MRPTPIPTRHAPHYTSLCFAGTAFTLWLVANRLLTTCSIVDLKTLSHVHCILACPCLRLLRNRRACNRLGIDSTTSPLLKMTFETAAKFLTDAALTGGSDSLTSPAARLVVGAVTEVGTGCCQLLHES